MPFTPEEKFELLTREEVQRYFGELADIGGDEPS